MKVSSSLKPVHDQNCDQEANKVASKRTMKKQVFLQGSLTYQIAMWATKIPAATVHIKSAWNQSKGSPSNKTICLYLLENPSYLTTFYRVRILTGNYSVAKTQHQKGSCCISCWKDKLLKTSHMVNTTITTVMGLHPLLRPTGQVRMVDESETNWQTSLSYKFQGIYFCIPQ